MSFGAAGAPPASGVSDRDPLRFNSQPFGMYIDALRDLFTRFQSQKALNAIGKRDFRAGADQLSR